MEFGNIKMTMKADLGFMFGDINSMRVTEEYTDTDGITDEQMKSQFELSEEDLKDQNYKSYKYSRKDNNTVVVEAEGDIAKMKEKAKEYLEKQGMTCK